MLACLNHDRPPVDSYIYESDEAVAMHFVHAVLSRLPNTDLRAKGILNLREKPERGCVPDDPGGGRRLQLASSGVSSNPSLKSC